MNLVYLNVGLIVFGILFALLGKKIENAEYKEEFLRKLRTKDVDTAFGAVGWTMIIFAVVFAAFNVGNFFIAREFMGTYPDMKEFLDNNVSNEYEAFAFREKKLKYNEYLFSYQWRVKEIPDWTFADERILKFEPIK